MRCILQKAEDKMSRAFMKPGSSYLFRVLKHKKLPLVALCLSLFLVGSCNESAGVFDFSNKPADLQKLTKVELVRYGYALQIALLQAPENIKKLQADEIKLALSMPDFERKDGSNSIWQYRTEGCVLDVFWQHKAQSKPVAHFEIRQRLSVLDGTQEIVDPVKWQCVQTIIQERRRDIDSGFSDIYADLSLNAHKS